MRLFKPFSTSGALLVVSALALTSVPALANESATKEAQLEQRINELEAQLARVSAQMQSNTASQSTLETRIAELQTASGGADNALAMSWDNGIRFGSADKRFSFKFGGRLQNDWATYSANDDADALLGHNAFETGTEFRRARLYLAGTIYGNVGFKAQYDFAGGAVGFKDVYMTLNHPCIGLITVGNHYEPFGFETNTSDLNTLFMERSFTDALSPERNVGISVANSLNDNWGWHVGVFRDSNGAANDTGNFDGGEWAFTGRLAGEVWEDADSGQLLHAGVNVSRRHVGSGVTNAVAGIEDETIRVASRGGQHIGANLVDTGAIGLDDQWSNWWGADLGFAAGPLWLQAEYIEQMYDNSVSRMNFSAMSFAASYMLTGEDRPYDKKSHNLGRVMPAHNYGDGDGTGAWEVAGRYDAIDLDDNPSSAGEADQWTAGINWYLNPNTKVMWNYVYIDLEHGAQVDVFEMRFQVDF